MIKNIGKLSAFAAKLVSGVFSRRYNQTPSPGSAVVVRGFKPEADPKLYGGKVGRALLRQEPWAQTLTVARPRRHLTTARMRRLHRKASLAELRKLRWAEVPFAVTAKARKELFRGMRWAKDPGDC